MLSKKGTKAFLKDLFKLDAEPSVEYPHSDYIVEYVLDKLLSEKEREIVCLRYGMNGESAMTHPEIAEKLGIAKTSSATTLSEALKRIRQSSIHSKRLQALTEGDVSKTVSCLSEVTIESYNPEKVSIYDFRLRPHVYAWFEKQGCKTLADVHANVELPAKNMDDLNQVMDAFYPRECITGRPNDDAPNYTSLVCAVGFGSRGRVPRDMRGIVEDALDKLSERGASVMRLRWGLMGGEYHTLEDTGTLCGCRRERVRQIEAKCIRILNRCPSDHLLRERMELLRRTSSEHIEEIMHLRQQLADAQNKIIALNSDNPRVVQYASNIAIEDVEGFSVRTCNVLLRAGFKNLGELMILSEEQLACIRNLGPLGIQEIKAAFEQARLDA